MDKDGVVPVVCSFSFTLKTTLSTFSMPSGRLLQLNIVAGKKYTLRVNTGMDNTSKSGVYRHFYIFL